MKSVKFNLRMQGMSLAARCRSGSGGAMRRFLFSGNLPRIAVGVWIFVCAMAIQEVSGRATVFVLSLDGWRHDYTARAETPFLDEIMQTGAYSHEAVPAFPSVTFQSHAAIATGALPMQHGITGNRFYDNRTKTLHHYAGAAALLEAEPIWTTAARQGVRVLVLDWVNAHQQIGPAAADYFLEAYTRGISDEERVQRVLETWRDDPVDEPLRLVFAYGESPDKEGHLLGPDSPVIAQRIAELDQFLRQTYDQALALWERTRTEGDSFYFVFLSDHGMSRITHTVDLQAAAALGHAAGVTLVTGGNIGHLFFDQVAEEKRRQFLEQRAIRNLSRHPFLTVFRRSELPETWQFHHPHRTGDLVVVLDHHHAFRGNQGGVREEVGLLSGRAGGHGFNPEQNQDMLTVFYLKRFPEALGGHDLGRISLLQVHATIARILNIEAASSALNQPLMLPE